MAVIVPVVKVAFSAIKGAISAAVNTIASLISGVLTIFDGLTTFISGVFTGNWRKAWEGIKTIFKGVFDSLAALCKTYIKDSYACIKERGREKAASRLQYWLRQTERKPKQYYYLKLDISKFFYRVDHEVLLNILKRRIKDERLIKLFDKIINSEKRAFGLPLGVDPCEIDPREMLFDKGMPIGNLTSQMFANIYMNELDQYLKHELHLKYVIRYADDCIILHDSKEELWQVLEKVETFLLENLKLNLNNKTVIRPTTCNIDFVGYMINKDEIRLRSATVKRMRSRIKYIVKAYERGEMTLQEVNATMQSYFGLIKHCTNEGLRENIINGFVLHCTDAARAKARESR